MAGMTHPTEAPGKPGIEPRWTTSAKTGLGTALSPLSRVWFTLSHGVLNEIYYPRVDQACVRDFGLLVSDGESFFAEEKRDTTSEVRTVEDGVPAYLLTNTHTGGRFRIQKHIVADPARATVLQRIWMDPQHDRELRLFALLSPHLVNAGAHNTAWLGDYKGQQMLFAQGGGSFLALACSHPWAARSVGYVGVSDGWQDVSRNFALTNQYERAADGNVALTGEIALPSEGSFTLALGFGRSWAEAAYRARSSLMAEFDGIAERYARAWRDWQNELRELDRTPEHSQGEHSHNVYRVSTAVMRSHDSPDFPGGLIASLSIPWGASKGDDDLGGYHLVWPRDLVQTAGGLLAAGANAVAVRVLEYLRATQEADGRWPQNTWLDGTQYWGGVQMDECALPILLVDMAERAGALEGDPLRDYWPMVRAAAGFVVRNGPITGQDRWEEDSGFTAYTLGAEIAGLLVAADLAERVGEKLTARFLRDTADSWNASLDEWLFARGGPLAEQVGVDGFYVRIAPDTAPLAAAKLDGTVVVKNRPENESLYPADTLVSPDALALVRFGLREADDPRIEQTVRVIDAVLRRELPAGPYWYRYNHDGYGEHRDGAPFDGAGHGRLWPLMTGERAHYALARGETAEAGRLLATFEAGASEGFMLPEQIWDMDDIPQRELFRGRPSGSAMPLVWAHAEHVKLLRSVADGAVYDMPPQTVQRYLKDRTPARVAPWRPTFRAERMAAGRVLRVELPAPGTVRWSTDNWAMVHETATADTGLGVHAAELPTAELGEGATVLLTWREGESWAGENFSVAVTQGG